MSINIAITAARDTCIFRKVASVRTVLHSRDSNCPSRQLPCCTFVPSSLPERLSTLHRSALAIVDGTVWCGLARRGCLCVTIYTRYTFSFQASVDIVDNLCDVPDNGGTVPLCSKLLFFHIYSGTNFDATFFLKCAVDDRLYKNKNVMQPCCKGVANLQHNLANQTLTPHSHVPTAPDGSAARNSIFFENDIMSAVFFAISYLSINKKIVYKSNHSKSPQMCSNAICIQ